MYDRLRPFNDLPALPPAADLEDIGLYRAIADAVLVLGELNGLVRSLSNPNLLIDTIVLQESRGSSEIENVVTTQDELYQALTVPASQPNEAVKEVLRYRTALRTGLVAMNTLPLSKRVALHVHQELMGHAMGIRNVPGTVLKGSDGQLVYTPPDKQEVIHAKLDNLFDYLHSTAEAAHPLIRLAVAHYQFEAIHPFTDGNGRVGRILNILYLVEKKMLDSPVLYLSAYFLQTRVQYNLGLRRVTEQGEWVAWVQYVIQGIAQTAAASITRIREIIAVKQQMVSQIEEVINKSTAHLLTDTLFFLPYATIESVAQAMQVEYLTARSYLQKLDKAGILSVRKTGKPHYFINRNLIQVLEKPLLNEAM